MKKIIATILLGGLIFSGCRKIDVPVPPQINLGVTSQSTKIVKVSPIISNGSSVTVSMNTTSGSKYSLTVTYLLDNELKSVGFTASDSTTQKTLDLSSLKTGDYNLILTDIKGSESKINIIIKK